MMIKNTIAIVVLGLLSIALPLRSQNAPAAAPAAPRVDVNTLVHAHPLYPTLQQYDRQIGALEATLHASLSRSAGARMNADTLALRSQINAVAAQIESLRARREASYAARETAAASTLLAQPNASAPSQAAVRDRVQRSYDAEYAQLRSGADTDMASYQRRLLAEEQRAYNAFVDSMSDRVEQAYSARAQELREQVARVLLDLARKHAAQRLELRAKLQTLALFPERRRAYQAQLHALQRSEDAVANAMRRRNAATLAHYRSVLIDEARREIVAMAAQLQARTSANLAARRAVLAAQQATPARLPITAPTPATATTRADIRAELEGLRAHARSDFSDQANASTGAYTEVRNDVAARFQLLRARDAESIRAADAQIADLRRDRTLLYEQIVAEIAQYAKREAQAHPGADVTRYVRSDLRSLSS
jgi:hypothetical protein